MCSSDLVLLPAAGTDGEGAAASADKTPGKEPAVPSGDADATQETLAKNTDLLRFCMRWLDGKPDTHLLHAIMDICARLTRRHELALIFLHEGGIDKVLHLPQAQHSLGRPL